MFSHGLKRDGEGPGDIFARDPGPDQAAALDLTEGVRPVFLASGKISLSDINIPGSSWSYIPGS
jgi:hypothetical protein